MQSLNALHGFPAASVEVALTSGLSNEMKVLVGTNIPTSFLLLSFPCREQHLLTPWLGNRLGFPHGLNADGAVGRPSGVGGVGLQGSGAAG